KNQEYLVALDQLTRLLDRFGRAIGIIVGNEVDLAPVHAAIVVDHPEIGTHRLADDAIGRRRPAVRHNVADLDFGVGYARIVFLLRGSWQRRRVAVTLGLSGLIILERRALC